MRDYSAPILGAINQRTSKSADSVLLIAGLSPGSQVYQELRMLVDKSLIKALPDYLPQNDVKKLKDMLSQDKGHWMKEEWEYYYNLKVLRKLCYFYLRGEITHSQIVFLGCTFLNLYGWWYQSDEELEIAKMEFRDAPEANIPPLNTSEEIYSGSHRFEEDLYDVLKIEEGAIHRYCRERGWPVIPIKWIINKLEWFREQVNSNQSPHSEWDFEQELILQFRKVRKLLPEVRFRESISDPKPEHYLMSTRGNNYNDFSYLRRLLEGDGWNNPIPTSMGSLFWYESNLFPEFRGHPDQVKLTRNFDYYDLGTGKKNGGSFRVFYYTSPQNNMFGNIATKLIVRGQETNRFCAYRDQALGQEPLWTAWDLIGIDSHEYSDHQTICILKWILETYGFGRYSAPLAGLLQLPIKISDDRYLTPANGSEAGGKLDVALINDAGLIESWLAGKYCREEFDAYICGDDWTYIMKHTVSMNVFLSLHSICACFNQIVNPDKTEWLDRDNYAGFCKVIVKKDNPLNRPASGLPVNLWLKEPSSIRDIAQIVRSLVKTRHLNDLFPDKEEAKRMIRDLALFWRNEIEEAEQFFKSEGNFDDRLRSALVIPSDYGGLAIDENDYDYEVALNGILNGVTKIVDEYKKMPVAIAKYLKNSKYFSGVFCEYLSEEMVEGLGTVLNLVRDITTVNKQWNRDHMYDQSILRGILRQAQDLAQDYVSNSDGKSRKSTKDRTTPTRDGDCFLDGYKNSVKKPALITQEKTTLSDLYLLDCLEANKQLTKILQLDAFVRIRNTLEDLQKKGVIDSYSGRGDYSMCEYYCLVLPNGKRVRLSQVENDVETPNRSFLPVSEIKDPRLAKFVTDARKLLGPGKLILGVASTQKALLENIISRQLNSRERRNRTARMHNRPQPYSPQALADEREVIQEWISEMN